MLNSERRAFLKAFNRPKNLSMFLSMLRVSWVMRKFKKKSKIRVERINGKKPKDNFWIKIWRNIWDRKIKSKQ